MALSAVRGSVIITNHPIQDMRAPFDNGTVENVGSNEQDQLYGGPLPTDIDLHGKNQKPCEQNQPAVSLSAENYGELHIIPRTPD